MHIEHIAMYVNDLEKAREFFMKYFNATSNDGYHNKTTNFCSYFLTFDGGARIEIMNKPDMVDCEKQLARTGYAHIAFSLGSKEDVHKLTDKLKNDGYNVVSGPRATGDGYYESCSQYPRFHKLPGIWSNFFIYTHAVMCHIISQGTLCHSYDDVIYTVNSIIV